VKKQRPINLNLFTIHFPIPAIASILHRISGVLLFLLIPFILWGLELSLNSSQAFDDIHYFLTRPFSKFIIWGFLAAFIFHFVAGIRHLLMDIGIGEELKSGRLGAWLTFIISAVLIVLTGIWLW
jgi:succinate dehydrogenase / fumarate reductase, cytochrome b subunit